VQIVCGDYGLSDRLEKNHLATGNQNEQGGIYAMSTGTGKTDTYLLQSFESASEELAKHEDGSLESMPVVALTMLVRVRDLERWQPPPGFEVMSRIGSVISGRGTLEALDSLERDPNILSIEASRSAGLPETNNSVSFIKADLVHTVGLSEKGDHALVAIVDAGIDVLHEAFLDDQGNSRIVEIWDQTDNSGPGPSALYASLAASYGAVHTAAQIAQYISNQSAPPGLAAGHPHGTHVASIAAGRSTGSFAGGVAPKARIVVVVTRLKSSPGDPFSIGYSSSHVDSLAYIKAVATKLDLPVVVNISQGMNAGAHDGTSLLEAAFDGFSGGGRDPGVAIVKSAGNERNYAGHARLMLASNVVDELKWQSRAVYRREDVFELWFKACDEFRFRLFDPSGDSTSLVSWEAPLLKHSLSSGNLVVMSYTRYHHDNGDSRLMLVVQPGGASRIKAGEWRIEVESGVVRSAGQIDAWVERSGERAITFSNHIEEEMTLTIPGTAHTVISVGAISPTMPMRIQDFSSYGPTRDQRDKPDVVAPGKDIVAANAGTKTGVRPDSGTSMAAPHVTGAIALLFSHLAKQPGARLPNVAQVRAALTQHAQNFNGRFTPGHGYGVIDVAAFLKAFQ
jgi:subtilisin family serine protease